MGRFTLGVGGLLWGPAAAALMLCRCFSFHSCCLLDRLLEFLETCLPLILSSSILPDTVMACYCLFLPIVFSPPPPLLSFSLSFTPRDLPTPAREDHDKEIRAKLGKAQPLSEYDIDLIASKASKRRVDGDQPQQQHALFLKEKGRRRYYLRCCRFLFGLL